MARMIKLSTMAIVLVATLSALTVSNAKKGDKEQYIALHNEARAIENLPPVTWNRTVAEYARAYAKKRSVDCKLEHSQDGIYGENLAAGPGQLTPAIAIEMWVDEKANYDYATNTCAAGKMCGHYTQVVWKNTTSIGCASVRCPNDEHFMTCNYYPPGNYIGVKPF